MQSRFLYLSLLLVIVTGLSAIDVRVNGADSAQIVQGEDYTLAVQFSAGVFTAQLQIYYDIDGDGQLDPDNDIPMESWTVADNDESDQNPADGTYSLSQGPEDGGPSTVGGLTCFFFATDSGGNDTATLSVTPMNTDWSVAGNVYPPLANIILECEADDQVERWIVPSQSDGSYQLFLPRSDSWTFSAFDPLGLTGGDLADTVYVNLTIDGHLIGYDFHFGQATTLIVGVVSEPSGQPVDSLTVHGIGPISDIMDVTDENGYYTLGVVAGDWRVEPSIYETNPDYLFPGEEYITIADGDTTQVDFTLYPCDSDVCGTVTLDEQPISGIEIRGGCLHGDNVAVSGDDGTYILRVSAAGDDVGGYILSLGELPDSAYCDMTWTNVMSGETGINFALASTGSGVLGTVYDASTGDPIPWFATVEAYTYIDSHFVSTRQDGTYRLPLPEGTWNLRCTAQGYYPAEYPAVTVADSFLHRDFHLAPVSFGGTVSGHVYEEGDLSSPLTLASVVISSEEYMDADVTGPDGFYSIDLPNGTYIAMVSAPDYLMQTLSGIVINGNDVTLDFFLSEDETDTDFTIWPGDTNNSGLVDAEDILPIGTNWRYTGGQRPTVSFQWTGFDYPGGWNYAPSALADCNGDGQVNISDMAAIHLNWGRSHQVRGVFQPPPEDLEPYRETFLALYQGLGSDPADLAIRQLLQERFGFDAPPPSQTTLHPNCPNPFNPNTTISFELATETRAVVDIFNIRGQRVKRLCDETRPAGTHRLDWDGTGDDGTPAGSGVYLCRLTTGDGTRQTRAMVLLK